MAITTHTVTATFADLLGSNYRDARVTVRTNLGAGEAPIDLTNNRILLGYGAISGKTGTVSIAGLIDHASADVNPTGIQYLIIIQYRDKGTGRDLSWSSGWLSVTADANLADMIADQYAPPSWQGAFVAQAEAIRDAQIDISNIAVSDDVVEALVKNTGGAGPKTSSALSATIGDVGTGLFALKPRTAVRGVGQGEIVLNADDYNVKRDGLTDDTTAIAAIWAAAEALADDANSFGATVVVYLRAGRYIDSGVHTSTKRIVLRGDGPHNTILYRKNGSTGDYITLNGSYSGVESITIEGNRYNCPSGGDALVFNAYRNYARDLTVNKATGNGITIGKAAASLGHRLEGLGISECLGYGVQTVASSGSTDGMWSNIDIGKCGKSGVFLGTGSQNLVNVHSWGNGLEDTTNNFGFYINSASNSLAQCQAETNLGAGIRVLGSGSVGNLIVGCKLWGNVSNGLSIVSALRGVVAGCEIYRNGVTNSSGTTATSFAGIQNDAGEEWTFTGNNVWDDTNAVGAGSYVTAPTYPFPGRSSGAFTSPYAYAETNAANYNTLVGNTMRKERTRSGQSYNTLTGNDDRIPGGSNDFGALATVPTQTPSSNVLRFPAAADTVIMSSNSGLTGLVGGYAGRRCTIIFTSATPGTITHATTLRLAGSVNWTPTQNSTLTVVYDGANWRETSRTVA